MRSAAGGREAEEGAK